MPKSKKALALADLISDLSSGFVEPPLNENFPDEHLFTITSDDPWYGDMLVYLGTQKLSPHLSVSR